jgi:hypothetical protein
MTGPEIYPDNELLLTQGAGDVAKWYGGWPTFHDARIVDAHFSLIAASSLTFELDRSYQGHAGDVAAVTIFLGKIVDLEMRGFSGSVLGVTFYRLGSLIRIIVEGAFKFEASLDTDSIAFEISVVG